MQGLRLFVVAGIAFAISAAAACSKSANQNAHTGGTSLRVAAAAGPSTSRDGLVHAIDELRAKVTRNSKDEATTVLLADALLRQTRVTSNAGLSNEAERVLLGTLKDNPDSYVVRRMLANVYLSQHRFRDALSEAERCLTVRRDDAFVQGILGDAHVELGDYPEAFAAFDRMNAIKPNAASYARASYARELQGDLEGATRLMQMATEATPPQDLESLAWHHAQLGHLAIERGHLDVADREYAHADYLFPRHPLALDGIARIAAARGDSAKALDDVLARLVESPMPSDFAFAGDLFAALGQPDQAEQHYRLAEAAWRSDVPEPSRLARFLAEHGRHLDEAIRIAESPATDRHDIFTADAIAWAAFQLGDLQKARAAMAQAMRTGSRDRAILAHARAIDRAAGKMATRR